MKTIARVTAMLLLALRSIVAGPSPDPTGAAAGRTSITTP